MKPLAPRCLAAIATSVVALACGSVPTFADGIVFISEIQLPALAVAVNDTLRDSLGRVAPLRIYAFGQNNDTIPGVTATYLVSTIPAGVAIDANGIVTAFDSVRPVQIVGRVGDRLQTEPASLQVVAQPTLMSLTGTVTPLTSFTPSSPLTVTITGDRGGTRSPAGGIIVRYQVTATIPAGPILDSVFAFSEGVTRSKPTISVDTTDTGGTTSRTLVPADLTGIDTVVVLVTANNLKGAPLTPVRFAIPVKKGP